MIIEKIPSGFIVKGYDKDRPYFNIYPIERKQSDILINVGGISEEFVTFDSGKTYSIGQIVENNGVFYRTKTGHTSGGSLDLNFFTRLQELPSEGGANAFFSKNFSTTLEKIDYGTVFPDIQAVVDLILGYEKYLLTVGFTFDTFNKELEEIEN